MPGSDRQMLIDWDGFARTRDALGASFARHYGFFREDAERAVSTIEQAARSGDMRALIESAAALAESADQFGATQLADTAEQIELHARSYLESRLQANDHVELIVALRPLLAQTANTLDQEISPLVLRYGHPRA